MRLWILQFHYIYTTVTSCRRRQLMFCSFFVSFFVFYGVLWLFGAILLVFDAIVCFCAAIFVFFVKFFVNKILCKMRSVAKGTEKITWKICLKKTNKPNQIYVCGHLFISPRVLPVSCSCRKGDWNSASAFILLLHTRTRLIIPPFGISLSHSPSKLDVSLTSASDLVVSLSVQLGISHAHFVWLTAVTTPADTIFRFC